METNTKQTTQLVVNQETLFHKIKSLQYRLSGLAAYVQNDFEQMLGDGTTNKERINAQIAEMNEQYDKFISDLNSLRGQACALMSIYSV